MPKAPTPAELEAENAKLLAELEKPETPEVKEEDKTEEKPVETPVEEKKEVVEPTKTEEKPEIEPTEPPSPDYKEKFSQSSKEAQKQVAKNRKINQAVDQGNEITEISEEEIRKEYQNWDELDPSVQKIAIESAISKKRFDLIAKAREEGKKIEKWDDDVTKYIENPQTLIDHPELEGKVEEFRAFATQEKNNSVPLDVLTKAFLFEQKAQPKKKGGMFPDGSGGPNEKPQKKDDKISVAESEILRKTNYNKYKEYLQSGKISTDI